MYKSLFLFLLTVFTLYAGDTPAVASLEKEAKPLFIKVSDVPSATTQTTTKLKEAAQLTEKQESIVEISKDLKTSVKLVNLLLKDTKIEYLKNISLKELNEKEQELTAHIHQLNRWNEALAKRIEDFDNNRNYLDELSPLWKATLANAKKEKAPKAVLENILSVINNIKALQKSSKKRYDQILTDTNLINKKILELNNALEIMQETKKSFSNNVLQQNALSFSELYDANTFSSLAYFNTAFSSFSDEFDKLLQYYQKSSKRVFLFLFFSILIAVFVGSFNYLYRKKRLFVYEESYKKREYFFIAAPISTTIILLLLLNFFMFIDIPSSAKRFQLLILIVPLFFILKSYLPREFSKYYYLYMGMYVLSMIEFYASGYELDARLFSILLTSALLIYMIFILKNHVFDLIFKASHIKNIRRVTFALIVLLVISIFADFYGATLLADNITNGIFKTLNASLIFFVLTVILTGYVIILLRRRISTSLIHVEQFRINLEKFTTLLIKVFMTLWWFMILLKEIGAYEYVMEIKEYIVSLSWEIGHTTISLASLFDFIIIIAITWFIIKVVNILLEVELFARVKLPRGMPTVITTVLNYFLTIAGSLVALSSLGITLEQFAIIFGALGVGIGFGLRNIIANFISGIIMVFERPIQIGDTIEINNTVGTVQAIKTRSSIIKTFDGSEVIIPNADFIAKEITNWTLSDERRRKTLTFRVDNKSDIEQVLEIMRGVVQSHPNVLKDPEPIASFLGFGEYYLEFKLYFWLHENIIMAQSEIATNIYKTLQAQNIKMPTPKHDFLEQNS